MPKQNPRYRVALAVHDPIGIETEVVHGVLAYREHIDHWELLGQRDVPFRQFKRINLSNVDGVIAAFSDRGSEQAVLDAGVAAVRTTNRLADSTLAMVATDNQAVGRMGAEHLLHLGHARIGFFAPDGGRDSEQQLAGFREVIEQDAGRTCDLIEVGDCRPSGARDTGPVRRWLDPRRGSIAVMTPDDNTARWLIDMAAIDYGLRVPDDVAVLGVGNDPWANALAPVRLSTVAVDLRQVGYLASKILDGIMAGEMPPPPQFIPPVGVIARRSTDVALAEDPLVVDALRYMRDHCQYGINVEDVLDHLGISRRMLELRMKKATGQTPQVAIGRARIQRVKKMLVESDQTLGEVARACGFSHQARLNNVFKRATGMTPGEYRRRGVRR